MASIGLRKIHTFDSIGVGETAATNWNIGEGHVFHYFAYPIVATPSGEHGRKDGRVTVSKVECYRLRDNDGQDKLHATICVENTGEMTCGAELWQSWVNA